MEPTKRKFDSLKSVGDNFPIQKMTTPEKLYNKGVSEKKEGHILAAMSLFKKAAVLGHVQAGLKVGKFIWENSYKKSEQNLAMQYFERGLNKTQGKAERLLGYYCTDVIKGEIHYREAIRQGNSKAKDYLAELLKLKPDTELELGKLKYDGGKGNEENLVEARTWFIKAATKGNHEAEYLLATMYLFGQGGEKDLPKAMEFFIDGERNECKFCAMILSEIYLTTDKNKAIELYIKYAEKGEIWAYFEAGKALLQLKTQTPENVKKAMEYLQSVPFERKTEAQFAMATYHCYQRNLSHLKTAIKLYTKILRNPLTNEISKSLARYNLGRIYSGDFGCILITGYALYLFKKGAEANCPKSMLRLGYEYLQKRHRNNTETFNLIKKAYDLKEKLAVYYLGYCYRTGVGVEKDNKEAYRLNMLAIEQNNPGRLIQYFAGLDYLYGQGVAVDLEKAKTYLLESKDDLRLFHLGLIERMNNNFDLALALFELAHSTGDIKATMRLAKMYETGNGVKPSKDLAMSYYTQAARRNNKLAQKNLILMMKDQEF